MKAVRSLCDAVRKNKRSQTDITKHNHSDSNLTTRKHRRDPPRKSMSAAPGGAARSNAIPAEPAAHRSIPCSMRCRRPTRASGREPAIPETCARFGGATKSMVTPTANTTQRPASNCILLAAKTASRQYEVCRATGVPLERAAPAGIRRGRVPLPSPVTAAPPTTSRCRRPTGPRRCGGPARSTCPEAGCRW